MHPAIALVQAHAAATQEGRLPVGETWPTELPAIILAETLSDLGFPASVAALSVDYERLQYSDPDDAGNTREVRTTVDVLCIRLSDEVPAEVVGMDGTVGREAVRARVVPHDGVLDPMQDPHGLSFYSPLPVSAFSAYLSAFVAAGEPLTPLSRKQQILLMAADLRAQALSVATPPASTVGRQPRL